MLIGFVRGKGVRYIQLRDRCQNGSAPVNCKFQAACGAPRVRTSPVADPAPSRASLVLVKLVRRGHDLRPVQERRGHCQPVVAQDGELLANNAGVILPSQLTGLPAWLTLAKLRCMYGFPLYFTEPAVNPATRYFCSNRKAMTTGRLTTREAAMTWFQYTLIWVE